VGARWRGIRLKKSSIDELSAAKVCSGFLARGDNAPERLVHIFRELCVTAWLTRNRT
jgi:hypothetical protein